MTLRASRAHVGEGPAKREATLENSSRIRKPIHCYAGTNISSACRHQNLSVGEVLARFKTFFSMSR